ncbi:glycosyltransferase family 2 protein [Elizabethkingia anophelis]|uniref:Chondroitin polymerase n=3 Tax=Elizabethkingia TaxID=308865 RepID=A0A7Z7PXI0_9FLAO|nr:MULTISPECIES: glycosyltransferase family 2 protein [Elizabethkingia]AQW90337.1 glycosyl transferase family 2 [Elizabethkingia anophelis]ATC37056.1 glycosyl transferase family 2 [Elizabethkingia anophelis R26]ATC40734.1 glycosyl transferase family 2 [Elizabethkingia anophelis Ag1]ATC44413.1 glycosyl transferase family 2 [Elizabethkingia anophelis]ATC48089.1 glycosyl transferase family 2 [Elizabethkingia anophelis]
MKVALLISTYNWPKALDLVFQSIVIQTVLPDEILIADDGSSHHTKELIDKWKTRFSIPVKHFWQEDKGFRKTIILNKAIAGTDSQYIIQIDGDIILNKKFIEDHLHEAREGFFLNGSRSMINEANTKALLSSDKLCIKTMIKNVKNKINATRFPFASRFFRKDHLKSNNVKGCNFSFWKNDFIEVNGYNNDLNGWGHEDIELAARFNNIGIKQRRLKMKAVCYHLFHEYLDRQNESKNLSSYQQVVRENMVQCKNGYQECINQFTSNNNILL